MEQCLCSSSLLELLVEVVRSSGIKFSPLAGRSVVGEGRGVQRWDRLTERQLAVLTRIADGDDLSGSDGVFPDLGARVAVSAAGACGSRRLISVSQKGNPMIKSLGWTVPDPAHPEVIEHEGMLWKPREGATATADDFVTARALIVALAGDRWNPWEREDRASEFDAAAAVFEQWTRAEPGFRQMTGDEVKAWLAEMDAEFQREHAERERLRSQRQALYDESRYRARLALREQQSILDHASRSRDELLAKTRFPLMDDRRREQEISEQEEKIASAGEQIAALETQVGDCETVVDWYGCLPADRRASALISFRLWREQQVHDLREVVLRHNSDMKAADDKARRGKLRIELDLASGKLTTLLAISPLTVDDMCGDCDRPARWHGWTSSGYLALLGQGPCPAWPQWSERIDRARKMFLTAAPTRAATTPEVPRPQPLAVIPSGLPIDEVITQLTKIRDEHPTSQVRRGNRNRFEVWPA